jgi:hypothetical protein
MVCRGSKVFEIPGHNTYLDVLTNMNGSNSSKKVMRYNVCNGLANQLLHHASSISSAIDHGNDVIIPGFFIVNGAQDSDTNLMPSWNNSIPLNLVFDIDPLLKYVNQLGIRATVETSLENLENLPCSGFQYFEGSNHSRILEILKQFRPSHLLDSVVASVLKKLSSSQSLEAGVCLHHRDGRDWHDHCLRWSSIPDGVYRGNCLEAGGGDIVDLLTVRSGSDEKAWVLYCGDHSCPPSIASKYQVFSTTSVVGESERELIQSLSPHQYLRDVWALVDFHVCLSLGKFVGNSVSTWSALQIALRNSNNAYWYNSQYIPIADVWKAYDIPIVYSYTELSCGSGKLLLQASISSVIQHNSGTTIHVIYHGQRDEIFLQWLRSRKVVVHNHNPAWRKDIEEMRLKCDAKSSHLFLHEGNYFGTWQRIDLPLFVHSEYCLFIDSDTVVTKPFRLHDFGHELTRSISMSAEFNPKDNLVLNAGVMLMNIPKLRETHTDFLKFILSHSDGSTYKGNAPSDQGAYLEFYEDSIVFLPTRFNFKPYWSGDENFGEANIVHFHGLKPDGYFKAFMGIKCDDATQFLCDQVVEKESWVCESTRAFAKSMAQVSLQEYCLVTFPAQRMQRKVCMNVLTYLAGQDEHCQSLKQLIVEEQNQAFNHIFQSQTPSQQNDSRKEVSFDLMTGPILLLSGYILGGFTVLVCFMKGKKRKTG